MSLKLTKAKAKYFIRDEKKASFGRNSRTLQYAVKWTPLSGNPQTQIFTAKADAQRFAQLLRFRDNVAILKRKKNGGLWKFEHF